MLLILAFLFLFRHYGTSAAPVAASTRSVNPSGYDISVHVRDECPATACPGRSVWDIVWSCLATTFAVTWVSVHPNAPQFQETSSMLLRRRIFLMCLALLAPEVMIMWAFKQWRGAVMIKETINKARPKSYRPWTMTHAYFIQMRGFKLCTTEDEDIYFVHDRNGYRNRTYGIDVWEVPLGNFTFNYLLEKGRISLPEVSEEEINDRSKGDVLSKGIALLQITWFIVQLIARARQHLAITEIELTTAALAGLNSIMYLFWWSKPLDVRCPIAIRTKELERLIVEKESQADKEEDKWTFPVNHEGFVVEDFRLWAYLISHCKRPSVNPANLANLWVTVCSVLGSLLSRCCDSRTQVTSSDDASDRSMSPNSNGRKSEESFASLRTVKWIFVICKRVFNPLFHLPFIFLVLPSQRILSPSGDYELEGFRDAKDKMHSKSALQMLFDADDMNWIMNMIFHCDSDYTKGRPFLIFSAMSGAVFGSIHCAAWHFDFPSSAERILWQTASLSIVGICLCIITGIPLYTYVLGKRRPLLVPIGITDSIWSACMRSLEIIPAIVYSMARISLLVLSFLSLRRLPPSALATVTWTKIIPHV